MAHLLKTKKEFKNLHKQVIFTKIIWTKLVFKMVWLMVNIFKHLSERTQSIIVFKDKTFQISNNPKCDRYQRGLGLMVYKILDK